MPLFWWLSAGVISSSVQQQDGVSEESQLQSTKSVSQLSLRTDVTQNWRVSDMAGATAQKAA